MEVCKGYPPLPFPPPGCGSACRADPPHTHVIDISFIDLYAAAKRLYMHNMVVFCSWRLLACLLNCLLACLLALAPGV